MMAKRWLKVDAARAHCGGLSRKVLYAAVASGKLKAAKIGAGRNVLFEVSWLDEWLGRVGAEGR